VPIRARLRNRRDRDGLFPLRREIKRDDSDHDRS
jgi:hypothetical protein